MKYWAFRYTDHYMMSLLVCIRRVSEGHKSKYGFQKSFSMKYWAFHSTYHYMMSQWVYIRHASEGHKSKYGFQKSFPLIYRAFHSTDKFKWVGGLISFMFQRGTSPNMGLNSLLPDEISSFSLHRSIYNESVGSYPSCFRGAQVQIWVFNSRFRWNIGLFIPSIN